MSAVNTLTCAQCASPFPAPAVRRGKVQIFCTPQCRVAGANARRASTRAGRIIRPTDNGITNPHAGEPSGRPLPSTLTDIPPSVDRSLSDAHNPRPDSLEAPMEKAHSRAGINAFELATLAKLRGLSPWTPARLIMSKDYRP